MAALKLVSLNIERSKHLELVIPFIRAEQPDVLCLQEVDEPAIGEIAQAGEAACFFAPMGTRDGMRCGIGIFSKWPMRNGADYRYGGSEEESPSPVRTDWQSEYDSTRFTLAVCDVAKDGAVFRIGTTHFPVTDKGLATDYQRQAMHNLLAIAKAQGELVVCGDFNAPRGYVWSTPGYEVSDVSLRSGLSDHCAVVATITKAGEADQER